jgi:hypothetical protein
MRRHSLCFLPPPTPSYPLLTTQQATGHLAHLVASTDTLSDRILQAAREVAAKVGHRV